MRQAHTEIGQTRLLPETGQGYCYNKQQNFTPYIINKLKSITITLTYCSFLIINAAALNIYYGPGTRSDLSQLVSASLRRYYCVFSYGKRKSNAITARKNKYCTAFIYLVSMRTRIWRSRRVFTQITTRFNAV